ncbi:uncharacterized protein LOC133800284 [Humulus lupulus]|uniref:uncharacterized protein LOC133800284 n=1 Tax=Humulus lupulus TaxID=3486 RepID=UPI002B40C265|nr:uncharacterized protein LOC133800284 [Humulus lupulus]
MPSNSFTDSNSVPQCITSQQTTPPDPHVNSSPSDPHVNSSGNSQNVEEEINIINNVIFHKNKIFVGGLPHQIEKIELKSYFSTYGKVMYTKIMRDVSSRRSRGFGFITFHEEEAVENVLKTTFHNLKNKRVEVKRAAVKQTRVSQPKIYNNYYYTFKRNSNNNINNYNTFNNNNTYCYGYNLHPIMPINPIPFMYPYNLFPYPQPMYYLIYSNPPPYVHDEHGKKVLLSRPQLD